MTKITQDTQLEAGMKVMIDENEYTIIKTVMSNYSLVTKDFKTIVSRTRDGILLLLIQRNAKLIEDNAKVVVSEAVADILQVDCDSKESIYWKIYRFLDLVREKQQRDPRARMSDFFERNNITLQDIQRAFEKTTIDDYGWEVEKSKRWEAKEGEIVWFVGVDGTVSNLIESGFTRRVISDLFKSGNHFQTKEKAEETAKQTRSIFESRK